MRAGWLSLMSVMTLLACEAPPKVHVEKTAVVTGEDVVVAFDDKLSGKATNQYWIALQRAGAPTADTTGRIVLERTEQSVRLRTSSPGDYEVRLHGQYPKEEHHLLVRIPVKVEGWPVKTGIEPKVDPDECVDRWLGERKLDPYGSPQGTHYAGGSPLLDPVTGTTISRWDYVVDKHPEALHACEGRGAR